MCCFTLYVEDQCVDPGFEFAHDQLPESEDAGQYCLTLVSLLYDNDNTLLIYCQFIKVSQYADIAAIIWWNLLFYSIT